MTDASDKPMHWQHTAIDEAEEEIATRLKHVGDDYLNGMVEGDSLSNRSGTKRYLEGYADALRYAEGVVAGIHRIDPKPEAWDPRDIPDDTVEDHFKTLLSEAINGNWGNVSVNLDRLDDALEQAKDGDGDD